MDSSFKTYYIPDNFWGESRVFNGQFRTRNLIDSVLLSLVMLLVLGVPIIFFALRGAAVQVKVTALIIIIAPGFLLGQVGYNGDPFSTFLKNLMSWRKISETRLYNSNPRLLGTDPVKAMYEGERGIDKILDAVQNFQEGRIAKKTAETYVEGETFEFEYDPNIDDFLHDSGDFADATDNGFGSCPLDVEIAAGVDVAGLTNTLGSWFMPPEDTDDDEPEDAAEEEENNLEQN